MTMFLILLRIKTLSQTWPLNGDINIKSSRKDFKWCLYIVTSFIQTENILSAFNKNILTSILFVIELHK
jgi:hypothetical protein